MRKLAILAALGALAGTGVAGCGESSTTTTTVIEKAAVPPTTPQHRHQQHQHQPNTDPARPTEPTRPPDHHLGTPHLPNSGPKVPSAVVESYMAEMNVNSTTCSYVEDWTTAQTTASSKHFELPSDTPWETFTCTTADASASYFVVYEDINAQWQPAYHVQTS